MHRRGPRVTGPTREVVRGKERFRVVCFDRTPGSREAFSVATEEEAVALKVKLEATLEEPQEARTVKKAIEEYLSWMARIKENKPPSVKHTRWALCRFLTEQDRLLSAVTPRWCEKRYLALVEEGLAVDSHRNMLAETKTFFAWCADKNRRWVKVSPAADIKGVGKRKPGGKGKKQLTLDEVALWLAVAYRLADAGDDGAVAALITIMMGLRATEIVTRTARDVDGGGTLLRLDLREEEVKTKASAVPVKVPKQLQVYLLERKRGKLPGAYLFPASPRGEKGRHDRDWCADQVQRISRLAGVPDDVHAHGMRGMRATLELIASLSGDGMKQAAAVLRHESDSTTAASYASDEAQQDAKQAMVIQMLRGAR